MNQNFRNCPVSCPIAASAAPPRTWLSWTLSATTTALILSAASALALTSAPVVDQPIFLTLPPAPAAAESVAAMADPAPVANAEAPSQAAAPTDDAPPDLAEPQPAPPAKPTPEQMADAKPAPDALPAPAEPPPTPADMGSPKAEKTEAMPEKPKKVKKRPGKTKKAEQPAPTKTAKASSAAPNAGGATATTKAAKATAQGQSPAAYQKAVMKKIRGTRKRASPGKGSAVVGFVISPSGGLSLVKIVKSSGAPALDAAAVEHIQRAAPFPAPPAGTATRFSFEFVGK